ncbi:MAG: DUF561 domain-containing protein [Cyanobacteria bacterium P01_H01_bin.74]
MHPRDYGQTFLSALAQKKAVKIIAGIDNTNVSEIEMLIEAAIEGGAHAVDISADEAVINHVAALNPEICIFASSVSPEALKYAVDSNIDAIELGNFDALYKKDQFFSAQTVFSLVNETLSLLKNSSIFSVTIPGHLSITSQAELAKSLEARHVDLIQTEGAAQLLSKTASVKMLTDAEKQALTIHNTSLISTVTRLPIMTASGLTPKIARQAYSVGASAVGVGAYIREGKTVKEMAARVSEIVSIAEAVSSVRTRVKAFA